ncbi:MAG: sterol carrier protein domain-containing protein, partial [Propionibacteriaceae bacterium]
AEEGREPVALLWASESLIYGRYGYGHATPRVKISGPTRATAYLPAVELPAGSVDEVGREDFQPAASALRDELLSQRPGALDRPEKWWDSVLYDPESWRHGATALRFALHYDETGEVDGYASFRLKDSDDVSAGGKQVVVGEVDGATPGAYAALWRYLLDLDLVRTFARSNAPADEPLRYLVADQRAIKTELLDGTYARLVDLPAALEARTYSREVDVTLAVDDRLLPANHGTFRLQTGPDGASVTRSSASADVSLAVRELGAAYLGGTSLHALHRAGLLHEHTPGAVTQLADAFSWPTAPFCPDFF